MKRCIYWTAVFLIAVSPSALRAQVFVNEDFESYTDQAAFKTVWMETNGGGTAAADAVNLDSGYLIGCPTCAPITDPANYPGIQGQAADHIGAASGTMVNQWDDDNNLATLPFNIMPSATNNIRLKSDIFVSNSGNERMTVGLRGRDPTAANLIEMGLYNAAACDAQVEGCNSSSATINAEMPGYFPFTGFAYRVILHQGYAGLSSASTAPNWGYFVLPAGLDRTTDTDEIVNIGDVGAGWHTYEAIISPEEITLTLDLFRDGFVNIRDETGAIIQDVPGVDASVTFQVTSNASVGYDSLRIGGPSGITSPGPGVVGFDNMLLELFEVAQPGQPGDHNGDGQVDAADYVTWRKTPGNFGGETGYTTWRENFGEPGGAGSGGAVPEPATAALVLIGCVALAARRQR